MKKFVLAAMAVLLLNVNAFAYTESHITKDVSVKVDDELTGSRAPKLVIDECGDFEGLTGTTDFSLMLENAEWLYDGSGTIENGIGYMVISSNEMIITVDTDIYDAASRGIEIPVYAKITDGGTASLTIDGKNSPVSSETLTFAHSGYPNMEITIKGPDDGSSVFSLSFKDNYPYQLVNGRIYELKLTNGFNFTGKANVSDSGKFAGRAEFAVDKNKSTAYVKLETQSGTGSGTIDITGIGIEPTAKSQSGDIELSISSINHGDLSKTIYLGKYEAKNDSADKTDTPVTDKGTDDKTDENTEGNTAKSTVKFTVGSDRYYIDTTKYETNSKPNVESVMYKTDAAPYINKSGRTMVPLRAAANALGISDDNIQWSEEGFRGVILSVDGHSVKIPAGDTDSYYIEVDGKKVETDAAAEIKDGRTYLPIRSLSNALGINDDSIIWDANSRTVSIAK